MRYKQHEHLAFVYQIKNIVTGRRYIGVTNNYKTRWMDHITFLRNRTHHNQELQKDFNRYGESCFIFTLLERVQDSSNYDGGRKEFKWILNEKTYLDEYGYNGADPRLSKYFSDRLGTSDYKKKRYKVYRPSSLIKAFEKCGFSYDYVSGRCGLEPGGIERVLNGDDDVNITQAHRILKCAGLKPAMDKFVFYYSNYETKSK